MVRRSRWPLGRATTALVIVLAVVFVILRLIAAALPTPTTTSIYTDHAVVIGVEGKTSLDATDRAVISGHAGEVQGGVVSVRGRYRGACAAAGWTTLGAGRRAAVAGLCTPQVRNGAVTDWPARLAAAAARDGDAQLGTLAGSSRGCVQAVGPGAALAAAGPDGTLTHYRTLEQFGDAGRPLDCPITLIDVGSDAAAADRLVEAYAGRSEVTTILTGIGPVLGASGEDLQVIYRVGTTLPGVLTSDSTRRHGIVNLTDLTATLADYGNGNAAPVPTAVDGSVMTVDEQPMSPAVIDRLLHRVTAQSYAVVTGYLLNGVIGAAVGLAIAVCVRRRRWRLARVGAALATVWAAGAMMLPGAVRWYDAARPALVLTSASVVAVALLTALSLLLAGRFRAPVAVTGAALSVAVFTVDAALGGVMEPGSMLNSRPIYGGRWYGFGNVAFALYAAPALILAGYLAHRLTGQHADPRAPAPRPRPQAPRRRTAAVAAVLVVGLGMVACEGWPSMGSDFGGVIAMTPAVLWLALMVSGVRVTWRRVALILIAAVVAITAISVLDWLRGPGRRSHLGNFVQRVVDGDAASVVIRKAVTSVQTMISPLGIGSILIGAVLWVIIFRWVLPRISAERFSGFRTVLIAVLAMAVLGTVLNDGGVSVWLCATGVATVTAGGLLVDEHIGPVPSPRPVARSGIRPGRSGAPTRRPAPDPLGLHRPPDRRSLRPSRRGR